MNILHNNLTPVFQSFQSNNVKMLAVMTDYSSQSPNNLSSCYRYIARFILTGCIVITSGCAITPDSSVKQPMSAKPARIVPAEAKNGGIYSATSYKPLFEDRRARAVGDIITINITENTAATKQGSSSASKSGTVDAKASIFLGSPEDRTAFSATSNNKYEDKAALNSGNTFTGTLSVTVIDVLENGNLVVSGEKQVSLDKGSEFVRFSGVVNPDYIKLGNVVPSSQVADARIEYRTNSRIDTAQITAILTRFFLSFIPL